MGLPMNIVYFEASLHGREIQELTIKGQCLSPGIDPTNLSPTPNLNKLSAHFPFGHQGLIRLL